MVEYSNSVNISPKGLALKQTMIYKVHRNAKETQQSGKHILIIDKLSN